MGSILLRSVFLMIMSLGLVQTASANCPSIPSTSVGCTFAAGVTSPSCTNAFSSGINFNLAGYCKIYCVRPGQDVCKVIINGNETSATVNPTCPAGVTYNVLSGMDRCGASTQTGKNSKL